MNLNCQYFGLCGGCSSQTRDYEQHLQQKLTQFRNTWELNLNSEPPQIKTVKLQTLNYRTRADLTVESGKIGFFQKGSGDLLDIHTCQLFSDNLSDCYSKLRSCIPPIQKGSLRIRVSPQGLKGIWLDFSNVDIKYLLDEKTYLQKLATIFDVIEIGQKKKILDTQTCKLSDPKKFTWFETYSDNKIISLPMHIGSFSQTGFASNKILIQELENILNSIPRNLNWFEGCSGSGNLTLPLMKYTNKVHATEFDPDALKALEETLRSHKDLAHKVSFYRTNIHKPTEQLISLIADSDAILMDPPRSGLQDFLNVLEHVQNGPTFFVYVSCFSNSLIEDLKKLVYLGFKPKKLTCVDQFPFSDHAEWICLLER